MHFNSFCLKNIFDIHVKIGMFCFSELPIEILKPLKDVTVTEGEPFTLTCEVSKPDRPARWLKDGQPVDTDHCKLTVDDCVHKLEISQSVLDDEADYTIEISDKSSKCMVLVEGKGNMKRNSDSSICVWFYLLMRFMLYLMS